MKRFVMRWLTVSGVALLLALAAVACGGDSNDDSSASSRGSIEPGYAAADDGAVEIDYSEEAKGEPEPASGIAEGPASAPADTDDSAAQDGRDLIVETQIGLEVENIDSGARAVEATARNVDGWLGRLDVDFGRRRLPQRLGERARPRRAPGRSARRPARPWARHR